MKKQILFQSVKTGAIDFHPENISLKDDGFHGSAVSRFTEWWYFDAVFDNNYSVQMSVRVVSFIKNRFALISQRIAIYRDGVLIQQNKKRYSLKQVNLAQGHPLVEINGNQVIKGEVKKDGGWVYNLSFQFTNSAVHLTFEGDTPGWKGINPGGDWWAVIFPKAKVKGVLKIQNQEIPVQGVGYHDHNWDVQSSSARKNLGWLWGKTTSKTFTITWAIIFNNKGLGQPVLVVNENKHGYINIPSKNLEFQGSQIKKTNRKYIPYHFDIKAKTKTITLNISIDVATTHHVKKMLYMHYWRFHINCKGSISVNGKTEKIDELQIAECLRFK